MLPFRSTASAGLALLGIARTATALTQSLCSSQNTGADSYLYFDNYQSNGACYTSCQNGYAFAVVQYQSCWCSNYYPAETVNTSDCDDTCPGYPDEQCGSEANNLFGYVRLPGTPSGTAGASSTQQPSSTAQQTYTSQSSTSPSSSSESSSSPEPSTVSETVFQTVTPEPTTAYIVSTPSSASTSQPSSTSTPSSSSTTFATSSSSSPQSTQSPYTSVEVVTISGAQVTQTVTSTPVANPDANNQQPVRRTGLSAGAIAGVVIGVILGIALLLVGAFFLWRRKRDQEKASVAGTVERKSPMRNTSVLSKTGLLARSGTKRHTREWDDPLHTNTGGANSARHSQLYGAGVFGDDAVSPVSPLGDQSDHDSRRHSKPLVYDQRLNPSALWASQDANSSRISMQDTQDYSRPLGVMNPDIRKSSDSRSSFQ